MLAASPRPDSTPLHVHARKSVLIVDDDRSIRELFRAAFRVSGFDVRLAVDGLKALEQIEHRPPDAIVLDLNLPLVSGIAIHEELRSRESTRSIPVIIVTGTEWQSPFPAYAMLRKPVDPDTLVDIVQQAASR